VVLGGKDYGIGSSRAGGERLLPPGSASGYRRKCRADSPVKSRRHGDIAPPVRGRLLVGRLGLTGREIFDIDGITAGVASGFAQSRRLRCAPAETTEAKSSLRSALVSRPDKADIWVRSQNAFSDASSRLLTALMAEAENACPTSSSVTCLTFRVETPCTYISASAATSASSER